MSEQSKVFALPNQWARFRTRRRGRVVTVLSPSLQPA